MWYFSKKQYAMLIMNETTLSCGVYHYSKNKIVLQAYHEFTLEPGIILEGCIYNMLALKKYVDHSTENQKISAILYVVDNNLKSDNIISQFPIIQYIIFSKLIRTNMLTVLPFNKIHDSLHVLETMLDRISHEINNESYDQYMQSLLPYSLISAHVAKELL